VDVPKRGNARNAISLRLPAETLDRWKATGPGWQTRMAETLTRAVRTQSAMASAARLRNPI